MNRIFHDVEQNTEEWYQLRLGKITSSNFGAIMANDGKDFGDHAKKYAVRTALESITRVDLEIFSNKIGAKSVKVIDDNMVGSDMSLFKYKGRVAFYRDNKAFKMTMK